MKKQGIERYSLDVKPAEVTHPTHPTTPKSPHKTEKEVPDVDLLNSSVPNVRPFGRVRTFYCNMLVDTDRHIPN